MHEDQPMTADGWDGVHLGEATAHAWLDGALPPDEAARAEAHVATCPDCTALVAEARGLIAGASRILGALDAVPAGVLPAAAPLVMPAIRRPAARRWWNGVPARAAAAVLLLAGGSALVLRDRGVPTRSVASADSVETMLESRAVMDQAADSTAPAVAPAAEPMVAPAPAIATAPEPARRKSVGARAAGVAPTPPPPIAALPMAAPPMAPSPVPAPAAPPVVGEARREVASSAPAAPTTAKAVAADAMVAERRVRADTARAQSLAGNVAGMAAGLVAGRVVTPDGRPIAGAVVQLEGTAAGTQTDSAGSFVVRGVDRGPATVRARRIGYDAGAARVVVGGADTTTATVVLKPSVLALQEVVTGVAGGTARPLAARRGAVSIVGCWAVRPAGGWTAAAPTLPATLRLDRAGDASVVDERGRAEWRDGRWTAADTGAVTVVLPATGGRMTLALRRAAGDWRGTATWTATPATRDVAPTDVRLEATGCPSR